MALDPSIILGGQSVNALGAMQAGNQLAGQTIDMNRQNALAQLYQTQGAGIANGDPNALNALAGMDPQAAMGFKSAQQDMQFSAEKMQMLRDQTKVAAAEQAAKMSAEDRARSVAQIESGLKGASFFYQKGDRAGYESFLRQNQLDPAQYPFDMFPATAAQYEGVLEAFKTFQPKETPVGDRFRVVGSQVVDLAAEGGPAVAYTAPTQENGTVVYDPQTGNPIVTTGSAKPVKPFTESQSKDVVYATRAKGALAALDPVAQSLTGRVDQALGAVPLGLGRGLQSDSYQLAEQAGLEFLQAVLRKDTGAAITQGETDSYGKVYLPQPGDSDVRLEAKRAARARAVAALEAGMSSSQILATELALGRGVQQSGTTDSGQAPAGFEDIWNKY